MNTDLSASFYLYLVVFTLHFAYAFHLLRKKPIVMIVGGIHNPFLILFMLTVINLPGVLVFLDCGKYWFDWMIVLHAFLAFYELFSLKKRAARWPFLINHLLFISTLLTWKFDLLVF